MVLARYFVPVTLPKGTVVAIYNTDAIVALEEDTLVLYFDEETLYNDMPSYLWDSIWEYVKDKYKEFIYPVLITPEDPTIMGDIDSVDADIHELSDLDDQIDAARDKDRYVRMNGVTYLCTRDGILITSGHDDAITIY